MRRSRSARWASRRLETLEFRSMLAAVPWVVQPAIDASELSLSADTHAMDLDGDADLDMVVIGSNGIGGWLNDGRGQFGSIQYLHTENWLVNQLTSGDVDGDQRNDLIVVIATRENIFTPQVAWLRNLGEARFGAPETIVAGPILGDLVVADLNRDRRSEIVFVKATETSAYDLTRMELGANGFQSQTLTQVAYSPVAAADLDGDGDRDLLVKSSFQVAWYENLDGEWTQLASHLIVEKDGVVDTAGLADLDADGDQDLVVAANDGVSVYGNARGTFGRNSVIDPGVQYAGLVLVDADRDGDPDIQTYSTATGRLQWYRNGGQGTQFSEGVDDPLGMRTVMETADLTGDGYAELIRGRGEWSLFTGDVAYDTFSVPYYRGTDSLAVGDMNGDGRQDLVTLTSQHLEIRLNERAGKLTEPYRFSYPGSFGSPNVSDFLRLVDVDGDNDLDVITTERRGTGAANLVWVSNDGSGRLEGVRVIQPTIGSAIEILALNGASVLEAADFDRDGDVDFATSDTNNVYLVENTDGQGAFTVRPLLEAMASRSLAVAEMDGDGDLDLVVGQGSYSLPIWLENTGQNQFKRREEIDGTGSIAVQAVDLNGDGISEVGGSVANDLPPVPIYRSTTLPGPFEAAGDIDRDGDLDLILNARRMPRATSGLWWDHGQGFAGTNMELPANNRLSRLIDMEGDGDLDIVGITQDRGLQFLRNDLVNADLTGDGKIDAQDLDLLCRAEGTNRTLDFTDDGKVDDEDHLFVVRSVLGTTRGDANLDGVFDSRDLIEVFQQGLYETGGEAGWRTGDWNCDGRFGSDDLIAAFADGEYERAKPSTKATDLAWAALGADPFSSFSASHAEPI